ncbi:hypothetical protein [Conyzicola sp.]|uniref:hypothetical protein n=1 Tax=Conyzicola sp. TaxID=1969404 RepID=UPI003988E74C
MTELDDLRRVAFGRTSNAAEETAAAEARAALAALEAHQGQVRANHEAAEFTRARASARDAAAGATPGHEAESGKAVMTDGKPESAVSGGVTLDVVEVYDEPGYLHRLGATWRVWAVPAFAAFVVGIALTMASGLVVSNLIARADFADTVASGEPARGGEPGNLELATALLARAQTPEDVLPLVDESIDATTTHALRSPSGGQVYAAMSVDGNICLIVADAAEGGTYSTCAPPSNFASGGIWVGTSADGVELKVRWDGVKVTESRSLL